MCDHSNEPGGREAAMKVVERDGDGKPTVWCDPCIAPIVTALNSAGIRTSASCCGHGRLAPSIALADGRWVLLTSGLVVLLPDGSPAPSSVSINTVDEREPMSEYTPTTEEIREDFAFDDWDNDPQGPARARARFDRWLAAHDAEVWASAVNDG